MAKDNVKNLITPFGEAQWATLGREGVFKGKGDGKQSIQLVLTGEALTGFQAEVEEFIAEVFPAKKAKAVTRPFKEKDGKVFIKAVTYLHKEKGSAEIKRVPLTDAKGTVVTRAVEIGNGSIIRLKVALEPTSFEGKDFVKFWLNGIQVKKLEKYVPGGGFDAVEDDDGEGWSGDEFDGDGPQGDDAPRDDQRSGSDF